MKKALKYIFVVLIVVVIAIQFVPAERTNPPVVADFQGPTEVKEILRTSCYDCHSNETRWPWYSHIAPVSWLVSHDVAEGRSELNFSDWDRVEDKDKIISEIVEEIEEGKMPLPIYLITHSHARLSDDQIVVFKTWATTAGGN